MSPEPNSPGGESQSPPPEELVAVHNELLGLAHALYNLGTTVLEDLSKEGPSVEKPVGKRINEVVNQLAAIEELAPHYQNTLIPYQVLVDIDNARNPTNLTRERIERAAVENQFMNGKIDAIQSYKSLLDVALSEHFPSLAPYLSNPNTGHHPGTLEIKEEQPPPPTLNGKH